MLVFKITLYALTLGMAFFFGFWEMKLRGELTEEALERQPETVSDYCDIFYNIRKQVRRERVLNSLPHEARSKLNVIIGLKFVFALILFIEVVLLQ